MRAKDFVHPKSKSLRTFLVQVKLKQQGYSNIINTTIQARTPELARRILRAQYNDRNVIVGQPRELKAG